MQIKFCWFILPYWCNENTVLFLWYPSDIIINHNSTVCAMANSGWHQRNIKVSHHQNEGNSSMTGGSPTQTTIIWKLCPCHDVITNITGEARQWKFLPYNWLSLRRRGHRSAMPRLWCLFVVPSVNNKFNSSWIGYWNRLLYHKYDTAICYSITCPFIGMLWT